jgi:heat shock protein HslJ
MFKYLALILLIAGTRSCNESKNSKSKNAESLEKSVEKQDPKILHDIWALIEIKGVPIDTLIFSFGVPTLEIFVEDKKAGGFSGCNNYGGTIQVLDDQYFKIDNIMATKKYCNGVKESDYFSHLESSNRYKIEKMKLSLYKNDSLMLTFKKVD